MDRKRLRAAQPPHRALQVCRKPSGQSMRAGRCAALSDEQGGVTSGGISAHFQR